MAAKPQFNIKDPLNIYMLAVVSIVVLGAALGWFYVYEDMKLEIEMLESQITKKERKFNDVMAQVSQKEKFLQKKAAAQIELRRLKAMFPDEEKVPFRLNDLYKAIKKTGIGIEKFEPIASAPVAKPKVEPKSRRKKGKKKEDDSAAAYYQENNYKIVLNGGYHMFGNMFAEIANFDYPTQISQLKVKQYSGLKSEIEKSLLHGTPPRTMSVELQLTTYSSRK